MGKHGDAHLSMAINAQLECAERALQIDGRLDIAWLNKGAALYNMRRVREALRASKSRRDNLRKPSALIIRDSA